MRVGVLSGSRRYIHLISNGSLRAVHGRVSLGRRSSSLIDHIVCAERLVGHPTPLLSLKHLFGEEVAYLASHLKRLIGSKHPVVNTAREVLFGNIQSVHIHGIVVLLASKLVNLLPKRVKVDREVEDHTGITDSQRSLAVITERIQAAHMVHLSLVDLCDVEEEGEVKDMDFGNKISILSGDLLLSKACLGLAELDCPKVVETISKAISDMMIGTAHVYNEQGHPHSQEQLLGQLKASPLQFISQLSPPRSPSSSSPPPSTTTTTTTQRAHLHTASRLSTLHSLSEHHLFLMNGSLLANSCKAAAILAGVTEEAQNNMFSFAKSFSLACQVTRGKFTSGTEGDDMARDGSTLSTLHDKGNSPKVPTMNDHVWSALESLDHFPESDTRQVLSDIVRSVQEGEVHPTHQSNP